MRPLDIYKLAAKGAHWHQAVPLVQFSRLCQVLIETQPEQSVQVTVDFAIDEQGRSQVAGRMQAQVALQCQRCLRPLPWTLDCSLQLILVASEAQAAQLHSRYDTLILAQGECLTLVELVEDELILSLPDYPLHPAQSCRADWNPAAPAPGRTTALPDNPFKVLAQLKRPDSDK